MQEQEPPLGLIERHTFAGHTQPVTAFAWLNNGYSLAGAAENGVRFWSVLDGKLSHTVLLPHAAAHLLFGANDHYLITASPQEYQICVWDMHIGMQRVMLNGHHAPVSAMTLTPDRTRLISAGRDGFMKLWGLDTGIKQLNLSGHLGAVNALLVTQDERWIISGSNDHTIRVWEMITGAEVARWRGHHGRVTALAFSQDERLLLSASEDYTICCWEVETGYLLRILEGHTAPITDITRSPDGELFASRSSDGEVRLWRCDTWEQVGLLTGVGLREEAYPKAILFHPSAPILATLSSDGMSLKTWDLDYRILFDDQRGDHSVRYATARIALVGDAGVGKTGLGYRLAHRNFQETVSTHGQQFWILDSLGADEEGVEREVILWDFAGQEEYRLIHALFLDKIDLALLVFDAANHYEPMRGVEYWLQQLAERKLNKILVGAKVDLGQPRMGNHELEGFCNYYGITGGYIGTSAKKGSGVDLLLQRIDEQLEWSNLTTTITTATFRRIKSFVLNLKADPLYEKVLVKPAGLKKLLKNYDPDWKFSYQEMMTAVRLLEQHGYVMVLTGAGVPETILLKPHLLVNLASSLILEARNNPRGLGALDEAKLVSGGYKFPEFDGLTKKEGVLLRNAAVELLIRHHICFRQVADERAWLVFPSLIRHKRAYIKDLETVEGVCYRVKGGGEQLYAALVVQLGYLLETKRLYCWHHQAQFQMGAGEICGFTLGEVDEGTVDLGIYFSSNTQPYTQSEFYTRFEKVLNAYTTHYVRYPPVECSKCLTRQDSKVVVERMDAGKTYIYCAECGEPLTLEPDKQLILLPREATALPDAQTHLHTAFEIMLYRLKTLMEEGYKAPTCFISYAWGDEQHERWIARLVGYLRKADIPVVFDKHHDPAYGDSLARFISLIQPSDYILPVGTLSYRQKYENRLNPQGSVVAAEVDLINLRLLGTEEQKRTVIPLLVEGDPQRVLPELMLSRVMLDFRQERFYFVNLFKLIYTLYGLSSTDENIQQLNAFINQEARAAVQ